LQLDSSQLRKKQIEVEAPAVSESIDEELPTAPVVHVEVKRVDELSEARCSEHLESLLLPSARQGPHGRREWRCGVSGSRLTISEPGAEIQLLKTHVV